ncbi:uncharacterized protein LY89DRAFT_772123 [Mollisia scopiformis]|uniref:Uncharacterized protein n=1 Tax=Mollisia scopiformis TaxID=149040 RepID=A0A194XIS2_MOLSC|nr:uncharacterized protein LY89DRAFT_772123 [Mollisia scopiformis]KUJ19662.1 hypothetical protein LY89DRAFT_772123 [Mollisia scopiformis]
MLLPNCYYSQLFVDRMYADANSAIASTRGFDLAEIMLHSLLQDDPGQLSVEPLRASSDVGCGREALESPPFLDPSQTISHNSLFSTPSQVACNYKKTPLTPIDLLSSLASRLTSEALLLNFDHFTLHKRYSLFLDAVEAEFRDEIIEYEKINGRDEGKCETLFRYMFFEIHLSAPSGHEHLTLVARRMATGIKPFIEKEGDVEIGKLRKLQKTPGTKEEREKCQELLSSAREARLMWGRPLHTSALDLNFFANLSFPFANIPNLNLNLKHWDTQVWPSVCFPDVVVRNLLNVFIASSIPKTIT